MRKRTSKRKMDSCWMEARRLRYEGQHLQHTALQFCGGAAGLKRTEARKRGSLETSHGVACSHSQMSLHEMLQEQ